MRLRKIVQWLILFSGEDATILKECEWSLRKRYAFVGLYVLWIFLGCFLSCTYAIYSFFEQNLALSIPIGLFFGGMVVCIYLLLLYTLSPNHLPTKKEEGWAALSYILRVGFIVLVAIILAKPLSVLVFDAFLNEDVKQYKKELLVSHMLAADSLLIEQERTLAVQYIRAFTLNGSSEMDLDLNQAHTILNKVGKDTAFLHSVTSLQNQIVSLSKEPLKNKSVIEGLKEQLYSRVERGYADDSAFLAEMQLNQIKPDTPSSKLQELNQILAKDIKMLVERKKNSQDKLSNLLNKSSFFIHKIRLISTKYRISWGIDFIIIYLFLFPVYLNLTGRKLGEYHEVKQFKERRFIEDEYQRFKAVYANTIKEVTGKNIQFYEPYIDAPFNTIRKRDAKTLKPQEDLLNKIYGVQ